MWLPTDKNMAGCDNCGYWVHDMCDPLAAIALEAEDESEVPYYCPPCKRQAEAAAKLNALRAAEAQLRAAQPRRPRSAFHLFSSEIHKCARTPSAACDDFACCGSLQIFEGMAHCTELSLPHKMRCRRPRTAQAAGPGEVLKQPCWLLLQAMG